MTKLAAYQGRAEYVDTILHVHRGFREAAMPAVTLFYAVARVHSAQSENTSKICRSNKVRKALHPPQPQNKRPAILKTALAQGRLLRLLCAILASA